VVRFYLAILALGFTPAGGAAQNPPAQEFVLATGTHILLRLTNPVNTKHSATGDKIYLQTAAPVFIDRQLVIPVGSYVTGVVAEAEQAGRVKGKSGLTLRFESLTLPNGVNRDFRSRPGSVDIAGNLDKTEGKIAGESNKGGDAATVGKTTAGGTGVGSIAGAAAGHIGMGAGLGAAAGALGGLVAVLSTRGPDVVLPAGTTMEMVLDRDVRYLITELPGR
jgi:type IV secretion system protein VirB10